MAAEGHLAGNLPRPILPIKTKVIVSTERKCPKFPFYSILSLDLTLSGGGANHRRETWKLARALQGRAAQGIRGRVRGNLGQAARRAVRPARGADLLDVNGRALHPRGRRPRPQPARGPAQVPQGEGARPEGDLREPRARGLDPHREPPQSDRRPPGQDHLPSLTSRRTSSDRVCPSRSLDHGPRADTRRRPGRSPPRRAMSRQFLHRGTRGPVGRGRSSSKSMQPTHRGGQAGKGGG